MDIISGLPLSRPITPRGDAVRIRDINAQAVRELLRDGRVRFVVADVGTALRWIPEAECFDFWKREVQPHLADLEQRVRLEDFPGEYCYFASRWDDGGRPVVLLSKSH